MKNTNKFTFKIAIILSAVAYWFLERALGKQEAFMFQKQINSKDLEK